MKSTTRTYFEHAEPILCVHDMARAVHYYTTVLGFVAADWGDAYFTCVKRDGASIYLAQGQQGQPGTWAWVGVADAAALYREWLTGGALILQVPTNYPWALEMHVADPDGNVLRLGSEPLSDQPYATAQN